MELALCRLLLLIFYVAEFVAGKLLSKYDCKPIILSNGTILNQVAVEVLNQFQPSPPGPEFHTACKLVYECADNPCENGGTCFELLSGYMCNCPPGFTFRNCHKILEINPTETDLQIATPDMPSSRTEIQPRTNTQSTTFLNHLSTVVSTTPKSNTTITDKSKTLKSHTTSDKPTALVTTHSPIISERTTRLGQTTTYQTFTSLGHMTTIQSTTHKIPAITQSTTHKSLATSYQSQTHKSLATTTQSTTHRSATTTTQSTTHKSSATTTQSTTHKSPATSSQSTTHKSPATTTQSTTHKSPATTTQSTTHKSPATTTQSITHKSPATTTQSITHKSPATTTQSITHKSPATTTHSTTHKSLATTNKSTTKMNRKTSTQSIPINGGGDSDGEVEVDDIESDSNDGED